jgi:hypothetical protein
MKLPIVTRPAEPSEAASGPIVRARAERLRLYCGLVALIVAAAFITVAALLPDSSDGLTFHTGDQVAVVGVGLLIAGAFWLPTRPRVMADRDQIRVRSIVGPYKSVPWLVVRSVEFRPRWQWARLVLPADETISLYAVQRLDGPRAVTVMRALRELHAAAHDRADAGGVTSEPGRPAITGGNPRELSAGAPAPSRLASTEPAVDDPPPAGPRGDAVAG